MAAPATSPALDHPDPAVLRSDVQADIARMLQGERTEWERSITEAMGQVAERLEAEQSELRAALDEQVEQLQLVRNREAAGSADAVDRADRAATDVAGIASANEDLADVEPGADAGDPRLQAMAGEISELGEYHATFDAALGALRSEIAELRDGWRKMAHDQAELPDRAEAPAPVVTRSDADQGRGRRIGRKGENETRMAAVLSATEGLAGEHQQLKADMARLEQEVRALASTAPALGPLRSDIKLLREQVAEQNEALDALRSLVETMPKRAPGRVPAAKRAPRTTKD